MKLNTFKFFMLLFFIILYHYKIHNDLEKKFSRAHFNYDSVRRPNKKCNIKSNNLNCIGMPSGHCECIAIFSFILYFYNYIPLWLASLAIILTAFQRIIVTKHTIDQVFVGSLLGIIYSMMYTYFNLSIYSFLTIFLIGILLFLSSRQ